MWRIRLSKKKCYCKKTVFVNFALYALNDCDINDVAKHSPKGLLGTPVRFLINAII